MHPALRKGPLFLQKHPISTFFYKTPPHFISCLRACWLTAVDCVLAAEWGPWSDCDTRCGPGTRLRRRQVLQPAMNGGRACGATTQKIPCEGSNCKVARAPRGFHELRGTPRSSLAGSDLYINLSSPRNGSNTKIQQLR